MLMKLMCSLRYKFDNHVFEFIYLSELKMSKNNLLSPSSGSRCMLSEATGLIIIFYPKKKMFKKNLT